MGSVEAEVLCFYSRGVGLYLVTSLPGEGDIDLHSKSQGGADVCHAPDYQASLYPSLFERLSLRTRTITCIPHCGRNLGF